MSNALRDAGWGVPPPDFVFCAVYLVSSGRTSCPSAGFVGSTMKDEFEVCLK